MVCVCVCVSSLGGGVQEGGVGCGPATGGSQHLIGSWRLVSCDTQNEQTCDTFMSRHMHTHTHRPFCCCNDDRACVCVGSVVVMHVMLLSVMMFNEPIKPAQDFQKFKFLSEIT